MFPPTFTRNSCEVAAVASSRKRTMAQRIRIVREHYNKTQHNLQQLMTKVDSYLQVNMNPLTQQQEYYACLQNLDYIALCLEEISIWSRNFEALSFEETPGHDKLGSHPPIPFAAPPSSAQFPSVPNSAPATSAPPAITPVSVPAPTSNVPLAPAKVAPPVPPNPTVSQQAAKTHVSAKKNNELLIDFSSASSLELSDDTSVLMSTKMHFPTGVNPSKAQQQKPPTSTTQPEIVTTKQKIDQLETKMAAYKIEEDDPSVCSLPGQEVLDSERIYDCIVSYAICPSQFYIMINPLDQQRGFAVSRVTEAMEEYYQNHLVDVRSVLRDMTYCAVRQNNEWFRCLIVNIQAGDKLEVYFVDYGGVETVPLAVVQPLVPRFCEKPPFARACHLYNLEPPGGGDWSDEARDLMSELHCSSLIQMRVEDDTSESLGVTLILPSGGTVNNQLLSRGLAVSTCPPAPLLHATSQPFVPLKSSTQAPVANAAFKDASRTSLPSLQGFSNEYVDGMAASSSYDPWDITSLPEYSDALVAVTGYSPRDESRICKHYKGPPATTCFKGKNCTKEHVIINPDGWTTDKVEVYALPDQLALPAEGTRVPVYVSHIDTYKHFYVQLPDQDGKDGGPTSPVPLALTRLISRMNSPSVQQSLEPLATVPALGEMVTAWFPDKKLYRAQVIDVDSERNRVQVNYVDFGNRCWTTLEQVYRLSPEFLATPFLAVRCFLADVALKEESLLREAITVVKKAALEKNFMANIICHRGPDSLLLELEDSGGFSLAQTLVTSHPRLFLYQPVSRKRSPAPPRAAGDAIAG